MDFKIPVEASASGYLSEYPLSRGQTALWFLHKMAPEAVAYNLAGAVAIPGDTNLDSLQRAFQKLAERHPMLRTLFSVQHGEPVQRVTSSIPVTFRSEDASEWSTTQLDDRLAKEVYRPFDLEQGPTWRVVVYQQASISTETNMDGNSRDHLVLLTLHHIIGDLWSIAIILSEIAALYREETTGTSASLKPLRASYNDHVKKEWERLAEPPAELSWNYWHAVLSGELPTLSLPSDRPRPPVSTGRGAVQSIRLDLKLSDELRALAEKHHVALYTVLLTAFQTLLQRYTGQNDILVGFPKSGRSPATARVIGYFVNQTVVRADFSEDPLFVDLLHKAQKAIDEGAPHDWYPFSLLVQRLQPVRDLSRSPLIQAVFSWQQAPRLIPRESAGAFVLGQANHAIDMNGLSLRSVHLPHRVAPFDLMMLATEGSEGRLAVTIEYATDLFDAATIARMAGCYRTLLESITAGPEQPVADFVILSEHEREQLVEGWNATAAPYPALACLHQLFEQQVERTPQAVAVASGEDQLTYRQLNQRANQLAHFLKAQGVGPDTLVGLYLEPSVQMVIALLGILKAGGAYLPLDPTYPGERLAFMLAEARPISLLTRQALRPRLPDFTGALVSLDADESNLLSQPQSNPISPTTPDHLAYVIYTSGSTGQPKGVALAHRGVVNLLADFQRRQAIQPSDACSWWTSPSFDVSIYEIFSPLLAGGSLQVIPENLRLDASSLLDWLQAHHIRSAYLPPFFLADFAAWVQNHPGVSQLHRLLVGVEPIPDALLTDLRTQLPGLCIINGYGPTETTICSTLYNVDIAQRHPGNTPIGRPVANTQIYLLDPALQPVPVGVVGELFIGGIGLARGYLNQPELTAQRFIRSPFRLGERLYRTGDLARYLPDGNLMYVGRNDTQVKFHGMRIELGEIEATLVQSPLVKQAAVLLREQDDHRKHLAAYVVAAQFPPPSAEDLRQFLSERLPHTMVPTTFFAMDTFPLTSTGKVDRQALPLPSNSPLPIVDTAHVPQTKTESILLSIWQQVLNIESITVQDNFFELGGDSILSIQIAARAAEQGLHLRPQQIFQAPTIADLAALPGLHGSSYAQVEEEPVEGEIPLTPIQHWFFDQNFSHPQHWNQSLMFTVPQPLDLGHLQLALSDLLNQHDSLRMCYIHGASGWQPTFAKKDTRIPWEVVDLSDLSPSPQGDALQTYVATQQNSLDLSAGPLIRVMYFHMGPSHPGRLLIVIHHLAVDGISWRILIEDLQRAYRQRQLDRPVQLPSKTTPFYQWARHLAEFAQSPQLGQEVRFWLRGSETPLPALPVDLPSHHQSLDHLNLEASTCHVSVVLGREETQAFGVYGAATDAILLTALARAFQRWTGSPSLWIDLEAHGREELFNDVDLTRTVGWFTAFYPMRLELPQDDHPEEAVKAIKEQLRQIPRHGIGYGLLRYLTPDANLRGRIQAIPRAQVSFNNLGQLIQNSTEPPVFLLDPELPANQRDPDARRTHLIEINAAVTQGKLHVDWIYSSQVHTHHTMEMVAGFFMAELRTLITHHQPSTAVNLPSNVPATELRPAQSDAIVRKAPQGMLSHPINNLEANYPLSPMQQGMVFSTLFTPSSGIYFEQITFTLRGRLDVAAFEKAWQRLFDRHAILRTAFIWQDQERMLQVVHKHVKAPLTLQDWRDIDVSEQQIRLEDLLIAERRHGFDLSVPPLLRLIILQTADDAYQVLLNHHHAVLDGWSMPLLFREVFAFYDAFTHNQDAAWPLPTPYHDYITWLQTQDLAAAKAFWRKELEGFDPATGKTAQSFSSPFAGALRPAELRGRLSASLTSALQTLARQRHITLNTFFQGAWATFLNHSFQKGEVLFGITVAGRSPDLPGIDTMLGLFINTLPLRVAFDPQAHLFEWLQQIQEKVSEIQRYDYSPLAQIQTWSGIPRSTPLFDTLLVFENYPALTALGQPFDSLKIEAIRSIEQTPFPLTFTITPGKQIDLKILYDPERFEPPEIHQILNHLQQVLEGMVADPNQRLATLSQSLRSESDAIRKNSKAKTGTKAALTKLSEQQILPGSANRKISRNEEAEHTIDALEKHLLQQWQKLLQLDRVEIHDNFFEMGGDSLTGAMSIYQLQETLGETIPLAAIFDAPTVYELTGYLKQNHAGAIARFLGVPFAAPQGNEETTSPTTLVPIQPHGRKAPLFCIHPAGGIVFPYYSLAAQLRQDQPVYGLQDPSLYAEKSSFLSIEAMASHYLQALKTVQPEGPYHLLGWSFGGLVAFEMAQQLSRQGQVVANLILLDTQAPDAARNPAPAPSLKELLRRGASWVRAILHIRDVVPAVGPIANYIRSGLFLLATTAKRNEKPGTQKPGFKDLLDWTKLDTWRMNLLKEAEVADFVSQEASLLLVEMPDVRRILEMVREHERLGRRYTAEPFRGRITLFRATGSRRDAFEIGEDTLGWESLAEGGVDLHPVHANHVALLVKPYVKILAEDLKICMNTRTYLPPR